MIINTANFSDLSKMKRFIIESIDSNSVLEIKKIEKKRSLRFNSAMHLYFTFISEELNNSGLTYNHVILNQTEIEIPYTPALVKEVIWKPIQDIMFEKKSTTEITHKEANQIIDVITLHLSKVGLQVDFPCIEDFIKKQYKSNY